MKVIKFDSHEEWLEFREPLITGTKLKDVTPKKYGKGRKIGFYKLAAHYLATKDGTPDGIDRGHELEKEAIEKLSDETGIKFIHVDNVAWLSEENDGMAYSPDGHTKDMKKTAEAKCLGTARHLEIIDTKEIPSDYYHQMIQSFIVNKKQEEHYFESYDDRTTSKPVFYIVTKREDIADQIEFYRGLEEGVLDEVKEFVEGLSF